MEILENFKSYDELRAYLDNLEIIENEEDYVSYFGTSYDKDFNIEKYCEELAKKEIQEAEISQNLIQYEKIKIIEKYKRYARYLLGEFEKTYYEDMKELLPWLVYENKIAEKIECKIRDFRLKMLESKEYINIIIEKMLAFTGKNYSLKKLTFKTKGKLSGGQFEKLSPWWNDEEVNLFVIVSDDYDIQKVPFEVFSNPSQYPEYYKNFDFILLDKNGIYVWALFGMPEEVYDELNEITFQKMKLELAKK